jgi:uncharacterized repeat protein (TIGR03803 family)
MRSTKQPEVKSVGTSLRGFASALASAVVFATCLAGASQAQTLTVLHSFSGAKDGATPLAGLTMDRSGNLYGTTNQGGAGYGTVFGLVHSNSGWILHPLYSFQGTSDGANPVAQVVFGPDGSLYGTTQYGGTTGYCTGGCGTVFNLKPSPASCRAAFCPWIETILRRFTTGGDFPQSELIFDAAGSLYGTAYGGGALSLGGGSGCWPDCGNVYKLTPSGGTWTETVLYDFTGYQYGDDGAFPIGGLIFDKAGNLYGTNTNYGNCGFGTIFKLNAPGWNETLLHDFCGGPEGGKPVSSLIADAAGNFYGATPGALPGYGTIRGSAYMLKPTGGGWNYLVLYTFPEYGGGPAGQLVMDGAGNLYGTTIAGGLSGCGSYGCGTIFKLTPSGGSWTYTELYDFTGGSDGGNPYSNLVMDSNGNFYGTASTGGQSGKGVAFEFTH